MAPPGSRSTFVVTELGNDGKDMLVTLDVGDPGAMKLQSRIGPLTRTTGVLLGFDRFVAVGHYLGMDIYDYADPRRPAFVTKLGRGAETTHGIAYSHGVLFGSAIYGQSAYDLTCSQTPD